MDLGLLDGYILLAELCHKLLGSQFRIAMRTRLHLDILGMVGTCRHRRPDGSCCNAVLDPKGAHAIGCSIGGWVVRRHNAIVDALANWVTQFCDCTYFKEQVLPNASEGHNESRMDLIVYSSNVVGGIHIDVTIVSALSVEAIPL